MISSSRTTARTDGRARGGVRVRAAVRLALALAVAAAAPGAAAAERPFPEPRGFVSDFAGVVDAASADSIALLAAELRERAGAELAVATFADLGGETIDPVAVALFEQWGVGRKGQDDGVLILLAVAERRVRIEVGYGLEGPLPDGRCGAIIRRIMGPSLAAGRYGPGLLAGARAVAGAIAAERGVTITGSIAPPRVGRRRDAPATSLFGLFVFLLMLYLLFARLRGKRGTSRDWRSRRGGWHDPWGGFGGGLGGGFGGMGGFGGGGGGGFGGFGGGRSGGGGASGGF